MRKPENAVETKVFLDKTENEKLIKASRLNCQSKVEYCTSLVKTALKKVKL